MGFPPPIQDQQWQTQLPSLNRSMHQVQLEIEYNVEETDNENTASALPSLTEGMARLSSWGSETSDGLKGRLNALCNFDTISIPLSAYSRTLITDALKDEPIRRRWSRWKWRAPPDLSSMRILEAVMVYERGFECRPERRCTRCCAGEGVSPHCVAPGKTRDGQESGPCSNCLYDGWGSNCSVSTGQSLRESDEIAVDRMAVLELIAGLRKPSGMRRDDSLKVRAERIEAAALHIAHAAREWGEKMAMESSMNE